MVCHHLQALEADLMAAGIRETWRGTPWTRIGDGPPAPLAPDPAPDPDPEESTR